MVDFIREGEIEIELNVNRSEINSINIGDSVVFIDNKRKYIGNITRKAKFVNENTQNISVFASINSNNKALYNGIYLKGFIITKKITGFKISNSAVFNKDKIFIVDFKSKLKIKKVNIIGNEENQVIVNNLENNTIVVNEPLVNPKAGTIVKPLLK